MIDSFEPTEYFEGRSYTLICGADEAGRGPLAGPVCAGACVLPAGCCPPRLNDSKKLSAKRREQLYDIIREQAIAYAIAEGTVEEINATNILEADLLAMRRAIAALPVPAEVALIDGNISRDFPIPAQAVVKGDAISMSIAAASILAKVYRDRLCEELDAQYPQYGIAKHKGYGTKDHMAALREHGPAPIYRTKFIRFLDEESKK